MARPKVVLNCAVSQDGCLAATDGSPVRFSDDADLLRVHALRAQCDAILVGIGTILADDPKLTVKAQLADGENPVRVILDARGRTPPSAHVLDGEAPALVFTSPDAAPVPGAQQVRVPASPAGVELGAVLEALDGLGIHSVMVEGGEQVLRSFLSEGCWDEFTVFQSAEDLDAEGPRMWPADVGPEALGLTGKSKSFGEGTLWTFSPE